MAVILEPLAGRGIPFWFGMLVLLASLWVLGQLLYNAFLHPLASYPGPRLAGTTRLWFVYHTLNGRFHNVMNEAHIKYGHVVRIAPNELSYTDPEGWNQIYGYQPGKTEIAKHQQFYAFGIDSRNLVSSPQDRHAVIRKSMAHGFSAKSLKEQEVYIRKYADLFVEKLKRQAGRPVDLVIWLHSFTFDVMGELCFGESFQALENVEAGPHPWLELLFDTMLARTIGRAINYWPVLSSLAQYLTPKEILRKAGDAKKLAYAKAASRYEMKVERPDLMSGALKAGCGVTYEEFRGTIEVLVFAGSETTATLMSALTSLLLENPDMLAEAVQETREAFSTSDQININSVSQLPYLRACLDEGLRFYPPVPDGLPRNTGDASFTICGKTVPPKTIIRMTHYATSHSPLNFVRPDAFVPDRWLGSEQFESDARAAMQPFHVGPRDCIGRNIAYFEMRLLMALLLWNFDLELMTESRNWVHGTKSYFMWQKRPLMVRARTREG